MLTHAARAAAKQLNKIFSHLWWPRAARAKGSGKSKTDIIRQRVGYHQSSPNQVLTHAARAAAKQPPLVAARGAREGLWLEQSPELFAVRKALAKSLILLQQSSKAHFIQKIAIFSEIFCY